MGIIFSEKSARIIIIIHDLWLFVAIEHSFPLFNFRRIHLNLIVKYVFPHPFQSDKVVCYKAKASSGKNIFIIVIQIIIVQLYKNTFSKMYVYLFMVTDKSLKIYVNCCKDMILFIKNGCEQFLI